MKVTGWTEVYRGNLLDAEIVAAALDAGGLEVKVFGDTAYGVGINFTEARLMVPDDQASRARQLIREAEASPQEQV